MNNTDYTGIILREEEVKTADRSGYINYYVREGKRASVGTRIYSIDETGNIASFLEENMEEGVTLTAENLAEDLIYMKKLRPQMIGVGPFIPHKDTPFRDFPPGTLEDTLFLLSLIRIMHPWVLLPATTALGTIQPDGREQGILAGANVVMPNISPEDARRRYLLYDRKVDAGADAVKSRLLLQEKIEAIGYEVVVGRGDYKEDKES